MSEFHRLSPDVEGIALHHLSFIIQQNENDKRLSVHISNQKSTAIRDG
jgi:hypothetical protein